MKKINKLKQKLEKLESQKQNFNSLETITLMQFLKYKSILSKHKKLSKRIQKAINLGTYTNFVYDTKTQSWIKNPTINCRKYHKLEKKANYQKNLKLYRLGLLDKKPHHPLIQNLFIKLQPIFKISKYFLDKINIFKHISNKYNNFVSSTLPRALDKTAVTTAKTCIKGYRQFQKNINFAKKHIVSNKTAQYFAQVKEEATRQLATSEKTQSFRDSLKVTNFQNNIVQNNTHPHFSQSFKTGLNTDIELSL